MKNITPTIFTTRRNYFYKFIATLALLLSVFVSSVSFGQNAIVGTGFSTNWGVDNCSTTGGTDFKYLALITGVSGTGSYGVTTTANGTGSQYMRFGKDWDGAFGQYAITIGSDVSVSPNTIYNLNMSCTNSGSQVVNVGNIAYNYVFKTLNAGYNPTGKFIFFEVQGAVRSVSTVTQSPLAANVTGCHKTTVTASLDGALSAGQAVYMRYTKDGYATSYVVKLTGSGTTYSGIIPSAFNTDGANVSYYVFTSGTATPSGADADLFTINLNTNGGSNFLYTVVAAGGATTYVPDTNFEQALIDLGLDCTLDDYVFTSNISDVTNLDVSSKNISNLTGIGAFTSLYELICENNLLTSIDVSALPSLRNLAFLGNNLVNASDLKAHPNLTYLDCDDNAFTSIDVSGLINLKQFYCNNNQLTSLDVRGLTNLLDLECTGNLLLTCILVDNVEYANTALTTIDPDNFVTQPFYYAKDSGANYSYCNCDLTTTWNGSIWDHGAPTTGTYEAIITGNYNLSANINACTLTINNNATVTIPSGFNVTLNAPITVVSGSFTLSNNANLIQTNKKSVNSGNIIVKRDSSPLFRLDYTMWSSPVSGTQTLGNFSPLTDTSRFYEYNSTSDLYNLVASTGTFSSAKGYLIRMPNTWVPYPGTPASWTGTFIGKPNNGDFSYSLSNGSYTAIGNPYPSTLNMDLFIAGNTGQMDGTLWFWRKTNNASNPISYSTCTTGGCALENGHSYLNENFISVGQGFIIKATASGILKFTNTMRVANNTNQFFKTKQIEKNRIWLNLSKDASSVNQMLLAYMTDATQGIDAAIDGRYFNDSPTALNSLINNEEFAVQGRSLPFDGTDIVPLAFKTETAGNFSIAIDHVDGLFLGSQDIILKDNTTGIETDLKAGAYTFTAAAGVDNTRFSLKYQRTLGVNSQIFDENSVVVYKNKGGIQISTGKIVIDNVKVFDIQGRLIVEQKNVKATSATIKELKIAQQVLIVKITSVDNQTVSRKVVD